MIARDLYTGRIFVLSSIIGSGAVDSVNGKTGVVSLDSDDVPEGVSNLYFPGFTDLLTDYGFTDSSSNWNTAYGWGNHASAGYLTNLSALDTDDLTEGAINKYFPGFSNLLTDYAFDDNSTDWDTAYGWGNHASAGYELQSNKELLMGMPH